MIRTRARVPVLLMCLGLALPAHGETVGEPAATPEAFWRAAGEGDVATVTSLLDQGGGGLSHRRHVLFRPRGQAALAS